MKLEHITLRKTIISKINFINCIINDSITQLDLSVELDNTIEVINDYAFMSKLNCKVNDKSEEETFSISIDLIGIFDTKEKIDLTDKTVNSFATMILFPYVQSYFSTLTTISGMPPLYLPNLPITIKPMQ